jgi:hypothetical protein
MKPVKLSTTLLLIIVTAGVPLVAYFGWQWQKRESIDTRYKNAREQLLRPRKDNETNSVSYSGLLKELDELIVLKSGGDNTLRQKMKSDVANDFTELFKSQSFDFSQGSNVELETTVLKNWKEYAEHLVTSPKDNGWIMYKYFLSLKELGQRKPIIISSAVQHNDGSIESEGQADDKNAMALLQKLNYGYRSHLELLRERPNEYNKKYLLTSFCWYSEAINNPSMVKYVFQYDDIQARAEKIRCNDTGQLVEMFN